MKLKKGITYLIFGTIVLLCNWGCGLDNKPYSDVSSDIKEAVERKVFIAEYKIDSLKIFDSTNRFFVDEVWLEKQWGINIDSTGKEAVKINNMLSVLVFKMSPLNSFKEKDFLKDWEMTNDIGSPIGLTNGKINFDLYDGLKANTKWKVYSFRKPDINNRDTLKVAVFILVKK